ncbi:hypothetical protein AAFN88_13465 [Pelagibius sp. CAU 1746]|uniref:hypothetical protein n=1 Tax=Pelagibius sp. CAU 1746 TaxID=3140370 RepID=UPI00325C16F1
MQHPSQDPSKGPSAVKTGRIESDEGVISVEEMERHIAEGKRMRAEAIRAFSGAALRRLAALLLPRHARTPLRADRLFRA